MYIVYVNTVITVCFFGVSFVVIVVCSLLIKNKREK